LVVAKRAAVQFPDSPAVFRFKGLSESKTSQFTDAIASYKRAAELDPTNADAQLGMAQAQASAGETREASSSYEAAISHFPKDSRFKVAYAELLLKQAESGNSELTAQVRRLLREAVAADGSNAEAFYQLGKLELDDGRLAEACQHLEQAVKLSPESSQAHFVLSRAYRRLNRTNEASQQIEIYKRLKEKEDESRAGIGSNDERN
jgi:cytochrome c-type biogenesis protein CcmH/NrfG